MLVSLPAASDTLLIALTLAAGETAVTHFHKAQLLLMCALAHLKVRWIRLKAVSSSLCPLSSQYPH